MTKRKSSLDDIITKDFGGGIAEKLAEQREVKFWKEAIERGEFDSDDKDVYIIVPTTGDGPVTWTYYTDVEVVKKRVNELNTGGRVGQYSYIKLYKLV